MNADRHAADDALRVYRRLARVIPLRSMRWRLFATAFVGTHLPVLGLILYLSLSPVAASAWIVLSVALIASLLGTAFVLWILGQLLRPVELVQQAFHRYHHRRELPRLPRDLDDDLGVMMREVATTLEEIDRQHQDLRRVALEDPLTGLPNRRCAESRLVEIFGAGEADERAVCLAMVDVDNLKQINDRGGHEDGDRALVWLASRLVDLTSSGSHWCARWAGDEFLAVFICAADDLTERLTAWTEQMATPADEDGTAVTVSVGLAEARPGESHYECLRRADAALYKAKRRGRNRVVIADPVGVMPGPADLA